MTDYFLHVDLYVNHPRAGDFERNTRAFLEKKAFARLNPRFNYSLVLALKGDAAAAQVHYVHLWKVPDVAALDLAAVMTLAADDDLYRAIDGDVAKEVQNFVATASTATARESVGDGLQVIRVTRQFTSAQLQPYLFAIAEVAPILSEKRATQVAQKQPDWHFMGLYQSVTGSLNTVTEFWQTQGGNQTKPSFDEGLAALGPKLPNEVAVLKGSPKTETRDSFQFAPYFTAEG